MALTMLIIAGRTREVKAEEIGMITFVQGSVTLAHPQSPAVPAKFRDGVRFKDVIETQTASRTKALFQDDSILTVGEHSRVEITEYVFDPRQSKRSAIMTLVGGKIRALVGRVFAESGSRFEIHTPTAVAAARGTYFVVWLMPNGRTGVANIGEYGRVDFTSHGTTVTLQPGEVSEEGAEGPTRPVLFRLNEQDVAAEGEIDRHALLSLRETIAATDINESLNLRIDRASIPTVGAHLPLGIMTTPAALTEAGTLTPPAVISGAAAVKGIGALGGSNVPGISVGGNIPAGGVNLPAPPVITGPIGLPSPVGGGSGPRTP
jgi:hypothetical protein